MRDNGLSAGKVGSKNRLVNILLFQNKKKMKNGAALFKRQQKEFKEVWLECWHSISQGSFVRRHYLSLVREFSIIFSILKAFRCWWVMGFHFTIVSVWLHYLCFYLIFGDKKYYWSCTSLLHCIPIEQHSFAWSRNSLLGSLIHPATLSYCTSMQKWRHECE